MSLVRISSLAVHGLRAVPVELEVDIQPGLPLFLVVGLPSRQVKAIRSRVTAAIKNSGYKFPLGKITINLCASFPLQQGAGFDLSIALAILAASKQIPYPPQSVIFVGELALSGDLQPHSQILFFLLYAMSTQTGCIVPSSNAANIRHLPEAPVIAATSLSEVITILKTPLQFNSTPHTKYLPKFRNNYVIDQIRGQELPKRVLEIALAGKHHLFLTGPPGSGKTMLAKAAQELLPPLSRGEEVESWQMHSMSGAQIPTGRVLRVPLPSISRSGLLGGGIVPQPGEISLAHQGILFLDEFSQMDRVVSESLRQPMEEKQVRLIRDGIEYLFPADCLVITAENACSCGLNGAEGEECRCSTAELLRYSKRHSEALLDRFDLFCLVPRIKFSEYTTPPERRGKEMAGNIARVRKLQVEREEKVDFLCLDKKSQDYLLKASQKLYLSARGMEKVVEVAQTIADLASSKTVELEHIQEALQYRRRPVLI